MPFNLLKKYNQLLDINGMSPNQREQSLWGIFDRDITNNNSFKFRGKQINPTPIDGVITMNTLYKHLTTQIIDTRTRERAFDIHRSQRLHWIKHHIDEKKDDSMLVYSVKEPQGYRTYIYDKQEKYVIVLEPLRKKPEYYLLSAFYVKGKDSQKNKFIRKYKRKLNEIL